MTEETESTPAPQPVWVRSQSHVSVPATAFRYRVGIGGMTLVIADVTDAPGGAPGGAIEERVSLSLAYPIAKAIAHVMTEAVRAYEDTFGPVPMLPNGGFAEDIRENALKSLGIAGVTREPL